MSSVTQRVLIFILFCQYSLAANIVILLYPSFSHYIRAVNVGKVLHNQGHNITIVLPLQLQDKFDKTGCNVLLYQSLNDFNVAEELSEEKLSILLNKSTQRTTSLESVRWEITARILKDKELFNKIRDCKPDLLILDPTTPALILSSVIAQRFYNIPFIFLGSKFSLQHSRVPLLPSVVPGRLSDCTDEMTFFERLRNTFQLNRRYFYDSNRPLWMLKEYASKETEVSITDIQAKALLWIITDDGILGYNSPIMPNVKLVSNLLEVNHTKPLPNDFQSFMDKAKNGVVIVSFGSLIKSFPTYIFNKFLTAFNQTKYNFVIRYQISNSMDPSKFFFRNWIPQLELLSHSNTRLFITHCGANGQQEAIYAGIPMIGIPVFGDQPHNAARVVRKGFGLRLDLKTFTVDELVSAIEEIITNPEYKTRTKKASAIIRSARVPPVEEAAFWINHVLTFGGDHLRSLGQDIPLWKYLGLDIVAFCFLVWHIFLFILIKTTCFLFNRGCRTKDKIKKA